MRKHAEKDAPMGQKSKRLEAGTLWAMRLGCLRLSGGWNAQMCNDCGDVVTRSTLLPLLVARGQQLIDTLQHGTESTSGRGGE